MKAQLLFILLCLCSFSLLHAQTTAEGYYGKPGYDIAYSAAATNDGGYIITGLTQSDGEPNGDIFVEKLNAMGDTMWSFHYGGPGVEGGNCVIQAADGGYLVAGHTEDFGSLDCDAFFMKLDKNGNHEWFTHYGGDSDDISQGVIQMPDGGYMMAGITASYGNTGNEENRHIYFVRIDSQGDSLWTRFYGSPGTDYGYSIAAVAGGGFLACGYTSGFGNGEKDGWLLRLNDVGDTLWTRRYVNTADTRYYKIIPTLDGGFMVAGFTTKAGANPQGLMVKLDAQGKQLWQQLYGDGSVHIDFQDVTQLPTGNFLFTGQSAQSEAQGETYILTTDPNGNKITDETCGGSYSYADAVAAQGNDSYLVAGISMNNDPAGDAYYREEINTLSAGISPVNEGSARFYPNPVGSAPSIILLPQPEAYQMVTVEIMNMEGQRMQTQENIMADEIVVNREQIPAGVYIFQVSCKDGRIFRGKFVAE
jgi:hypothetical protein